MRSIVPLRLEGVTSVGSTLALCERDEETVSVSNAYS